jgi:hypothetical protein
MEKSIPFVVMQNACREELMQSDVFGDIKKLFLYWMENQTASMDMVIELL